MFDVLIIGGGPAGIYAGIIASLRQLKSIIIEGTDKLGGQPINLYPEKNIYDWPGIVEITGEELTNKFIKQLDSLQSFEPSVKLNTTVIEVIREEGHFNVKLSNNEEIKVLNIIIATGIGLHCPIMLDCDIDEKSFEYIMYEFKKDFLRNKKHVVVLGGGDSALDWANHLKENNICEKVSIIHRRDQWRAREEKIQKLKNNNINIYLNKSVKEIKNMKIVISDNLTNEETSIDFDSILVQYGTTINNNSIKKIFTNCEPEIKTKFIIDINNKTTQDNIYAVGNASEFFAAPNMILTSCADATRAIYHIRKTKK